MGVSDPVPLLFAMTYRAMTDQMHDRLAELGREPLRPAHGYVFRYLVDQTATVVELAALLGVTKQAASKAVAELAEWGYVERKPHATDRRAHLVELTERGRDYVRLADQIWTEVEEYWAALVGQDRIEAIKTDLTAYLDSRYGVSRVKMRPVW